VSKILIVASEAYPLIKTGGLGDVMGSLPSALLALRADVRLLMPGYRDVVAHIGKLKPITSLAIPGLDVPVRIVEGKLPGTRVIIWLVEFDPAYDRPGNPYLDAFGQPWKDNAMRFALLAHAAAVLAMGRSGLSWRPDVVHCHDWQAGLVPVLLSLEPDRPGTVFTIHNLSYQGLFPYETFTALDLPQSLWSPEALEFHGQLSFMKGGIVFADEITTVSPAYAREIQQPAFGDGLDGLLRHRGSHLTGILNGIDDNTWDPANDRYLKQTFSWKSLQNKSANKLALQAELGLPQDASTPLVGMIGRLVEQKGIDLILQLLPELMHRPLQLVLLGSGEAKYETTLKAAAANHADRFIAHIGYDEALAHRIEAGADMFLMPSRFEPCGLNQLYSQRYGTIPIVHRVGGLADTVVDSTVENLDSQKATGIVFQQATVEALRGAVDRALNLWQNPGRWKQLMQTAMRQDFSWQRRANEYLAIYTRLKTSAART